MLPLFLCYALAALVCLTLRPLWLDEIIQLVVTTSHTLDEFMRSMGGPNPGAAPLGYLTQRPFALLGGTSAIWARLPSFLFSILSCCVLLRLCRELNIPQSRAVGSGAPVSALAVGLFMAIPLQFRYATEARPYSEALCFSLLALLAFLKLMAGPSLRGAALCILATVAAVYTQPYAIFSVCGAILWTGVTNLKLWNWKRAAVAPACLVISLLAFLPWYLLQKPHWTSGIQQSYPPFHWTLGLLEDVLKGVSGDGFFCSAALIFLAAAALFARKVPADPRGLLLSMILFPIAGALAGDAFMNYFFASRQILFALPGLAILAALGFFELYRRNKAVALAATAILLAAALQKNVTLQIDNKEDWRAAASVVSNVVKNGRCVEVVPAHTFELYGFFDPNLSSKICTASPEGPGVVLVSHLYTLPAELAAAETRLSDRGFVPRRTIAVGGSQVMVEEKKITR